MSSITLETPLAESLSNSVHGKIVEQGWTQEDDTSLAEYIVLMLANGKTQDQIASELAGELLQDASGTEEFSQWLFEQVAALTGDNTTQDNPTIAQPPPAQVTQEESIPAAYEMDMGDAAPDNAPRGPKGSNAGRGNGRGGRGGAQNKGDSVLHRTRGNDRINSHVRGAPKGPRGGRDARPGMQKALNNMMNAQSQQQAQGGPNPMMQNGGQQNMMPMSPQQQLEFMQMMEQQARMMAQFMPGMAQGMGNFAPNGQQNSGPMFNQGQPSRGRGGSARGRGRGNAQSNGGPRRTGEEHTGDDGQQGDASSQMDTDSNAPGQQSSDPSVTVCYFNLRCTNKNCQFVHQSPVAPDGVTIDMSDTCSFGAACKNPKCVGKHPSPAMIKAHQAEEMCKFFPRCQNPVCPFKHPSMPLCSFGASCKNKDCRFTHLATPCRFNPCTNPKCPYKHEAGQNKTFSDFQWTAEGAKKDDDAQHVSDRKFVEDEGAEEELVKPEGNANGSSNGNGQQSHAAEVAST